VDTGSSNRGTAGGATPSDNAPAQRLAPKSPRAALQPENVPQPKRPSRHARHPLVIIGNAIFTIILVVGIAGGLAYSFGKHRFEAQGPLERDKIVNIPRGLGVREIADLLQREGVIEQGWVFIGGVLMLKARDDLKSGEYRFTKQASLREVLDTIVDGKVVEHPLTIPEGLTSEQIITRLVEVDFLAGNIKEIPKEGTLLPETYRFPRGTPREQVLARMSQAQKRFVQEIWERRSADVPVKSAEQLVTLASIIEKETGKPDERSRVAAVFVNRLRQRMRLQSDPTIIYGLVGGKGTLGRPIMRSEIEQSTPYNTYVIEGLPPGPIANPGRASLEAAANPARTKELFFVADGTGGHAFAENLQQHQQNVARLRQFEQQTRDTQAGETTPLRTQSAPAVNAPAFAPAPAAPAPKSTPKRAAPARQQ
jgi:peptidoglycan lytic transglycosylase G